MKEKKKRKMKITDTKRCKTTTATTQCTDPGALQRPGKKKEMHKYHVEMQQHKFLQHYPRPSLSRNPGVDQNIKVNLVSLSLSHDAVISALR